MSEAVPAGAPFFLVDAVPGPGPFVLDGAQGRHASVVRRVRPGEVLALTDGAGRIAAATVVAAGRGTLDLLVQPAVTVPAPAVRVTLVQALPKGERSELAVELATEAGVDALVPWAAAHCVARWLDDKADRGVARWQAVASEAAKQSRRAFVPGVAPLASTATVVELIRSAAATLVLHEAGSEPLRTARLPVDGELVLVVGPEGGLTAQELAAFSAAGAQVVRLGPEVLRTSTAAAVALGALGALTGRWEPDPAAPPAVPVRSGEPVIQGESGTT